MACGHCHRLPCIHLANASSEASATSAPAGQVKEERAHPVGGANAWGATSWLLQQQLHEKHGSDALRVNRGLARLPIDPDVCDNNSVPNRRFHQWQAAALVHDDKFSAARLASGQLPGHGRPGPPASSKEQSLLPVPESYTPPKLASVTMTESG